MCNGGEGRTLKPCCDVTQPQLHRGIYPTDLLRPILCSAEAYSPPLCPSVLNLPLSFTLFCYVLLSSTCFHSLQLATFVLQIPCTRASELRSARAPASTIPVLGVLLPHSWVPSRRAAETLGREVEYERPYTNHRATVLPGLILSLPFSLFLPSVSLLLCHSSSTFSVSSFIPFSFSFIPLRVSSSFFIPLFLPSFLYFFFFLFLFAPFSFFYDRKAVTRITYYLFHLSRFPCSSLAFDIQVYLVLCAFLSSSFVALRSLCVRT